MRTLRPVAAVLLLTAVAGCTDGDDRAAPEARSTRTTAAPTNTTIPARPTPHFTITGSRSGFAHGYELVRRESPADVEADMDLMAGTGAQWFRAGISWAQVEHSPGRYDWVGTDRVVLGARQRGLSVVVAVSSAPRWAAAPGCVTNECAPRDPEPYATFVRIVAQRYGPLGIHVWEIWNEPNHVPFWGPRPDPEAYTELLRHSYAAIHEVDPAATVMSGGLSPAPDRGGEISPLTFLRRVYELGGGDSLDAVAHHPYQYPERPTSPSPANAFLQTPAIHDLMVSFGDGSKKIWGTEVGAPTRGSRSVSETNQAIWLREYYDTWNGWAFTGPLLWYAARDTGDRDDVVDSYGLVHHDRSPKPALGTFEAMVDASSLLPDALFSGR